MLTGVVAVLSVGRLQDKLLIDRCEIAAEPVHDLFVEYLFLPRELINHQNLEWCETNDGLIISSKAISANTANRICTDSSCQCLLSITASPFVDFSPGHVQSFIENGMLGI